MKNEIEQIRKEIARHESNRKFQALGYRPLFLASKDSKIVIIGQAPGIKAQTSGRVWSDASGDRLISWLGVSAEEFRDPALFAHIPMDFYYPGKGPSGDLPPRKEFALLWHARLFEAMPELRLALLIGQYAQNYYLKGRRKKNLTETVRSYAEYGPEFFPLVHPSPLNFRWFGKHLWFEEEAVPALRRAVKKALRGDTGILKL
jgi:uracil-DNA glycosylase